MSSGIQLPFQKNLNLRISQSFLTRNTRFFLFSWTFLTIPIDSHHRFYPILSFPSNLLLLPELSPWRRPDNHFEPRFKPSIHTSKFNFQFSIVSRLNLLVTIVMHNMSTRRVVVCVQPHTYGTLNLEYCAWYINSLF